ncbi:hypothetical protein IFR05_005862 [Cadophora sp. M221]|nr:hypothetical protein IFR05_005862 [Cadophora sp. M221]
MVDTARVAPSATVTSMTMGHPTQATATATMDLTERHSATLDHITRNCGDQASVSTATSSGSSTPRPTSSSSSSSASDFSTSAIDIREVVIFSHQDKGFTYMTENQLRDSIFRKEEWTNSLTWTQPRISSRTFEVEVELCLEYSDKEDGFGWRAFPERYRDEIGMPWKVFVGRNASPAERKFEKIFICQDTPEIYR